jgi:hypothetical protein
MKKYFFIFGLLLAFSCNQSTENKLKGVIEKIETKRLTDKGEKVESLTIDSVEYSAASEHDYWIRYFNFWYDLDKDLLKTLNDQVKLTDDGAAMGLYSFDSSLKILSPIFKEERDIQDKHQKIDSISKISDTTKNLFRIDYYIKYTTNKNSNLRKDYIFLKQSDLSEFRPQLKIINGKPVISGN